MGLGWVEVCLGMIHCWISRIWEARRRGKGEKGHVGWVGGRIGGVEYVLGILIWENFEIDIMQPLVIRHH